MSHSSIAPERKVSSPKRRVAIVVSHPVQYYVPLYRRLANSDQINIKVFFTWHIGSEAVADPGFGMAVIWDISLTDGYDFELVSNRSTDPGTHHFFGLRNPSLVKQVLDWKPDIVVVHGWAWLSHLQALYAFHRRHILTLFRGDSHLLDALQSKMHWWLKRTLLRHVFSWPTGFLVVGAANRAYYERFGVTRPRLHCCPHSVEVRRFAEPADELEHAASLWREALCITPEKIVILYAGKFERRKCPVQLMHAVQRLHNKNVILVLVGAGELQGEIDEIATADPTRFRVLPFQNQRSMPTAYRLGDLFVLPSAFGETWGLAVNEALSSSRPVLVSDRVGCASDVVDYRCGRIFRAGDWATLDEQLAELTNDRDKLLQMREAAAQRARLFDIVVTEETLLATISRIFRNHCTQPV